MKSLVTFAAAAAVLLAVSACAARPLPAGLNAAREREVTLQFISRYDADSDRLLSRPELETALKNDFAIIDTNSDGFLDRVETGRENDRRWQESGPAATPLIDWNQDGFVDYAEFSSTIRAVFNQLDGNGDGSLSEEELTAPPPRQGPAGRAPGVAGGPGGGPPIRYPGNDFWHPLRGMR